MTHRDDLAVVILAAGHGTRMKSKHQKILHDVGGQPMITHVFQAAAVVSGQRPVLVIGQGGDKVQALFGDDARYVVQKEKLGTGHATMMAQELLENRAQTVAVTYGDMPLLRASTLAQLTDLQAETGAAVTMLSVMGEPTSSFGRVVRNEQGQVIEIVEVSEAKQRPNTAEILNIRELNVGVYCFAADFLWHHLPQLPQHVARNGNIEYYLTDMIQAAVESGRAVEATVIADPDECLGAGTRAEMVDVERAFRQRAIKQLLDQGVTILDPASTFVDLTVEVGQDTVIWPNTFLQGQTKIGSDCIIGPNTIVRNSQIGRHCRLEQVVVENTSVSEGQTVPPQSYLSG